VAEEVERTKAGSSAPKETALGLLDRGLRSDRWRVVGPVLTVVLAVSLGVLYGLPLALLVLAAGALILVISMFWSSVQSLTGEAPLTLEEALGLGAPSAEEEQKRSVLRALKDLEYERSVGKLSEEDYRALSNRYRDQAKRLLQSIEGERAPARERIQRLLEKRLGEAATGGARSTKKKSKRGKRPDAAPEPSAPPADAVFDEPSASADAVSDEPSAGAEMSEKVAFAANADGDEGDEGDAIDTLRCPSCAVKNDLDARFCKSCGKPFDSAEAP
jgi:hypothetical protein